MSHDFQPPAVRLSLKGEMTEEGRRRADRLRQRRHRGGKTLLGIEVDLPAIIEGWIARELLDRPNVPLEEILAQPPAVPPPSTE